MASSKPSDSADGKTLLLISHKPPSEASYFDFRGSDIVRVLAPPDPSPPVGPEAFGITSTNAAGLCKFCQLLLHPAAPRVIAHQPSLRTLVESPCRICGVLNVSLRRGAPQLGALLEEEYDRLERGEAVGDDDGGGGGDDGGDFRARVQVTVAVEKFEKFTRTVPAVGPRAPLPESGKPVEFARLSQLGEKLTIVSFLLFVATRDYPRTPLC